MSPFKTAARFFTAIAVILTLTRALPLSDQDALDVSYLGSRVFALPDPETGKKLENWNETTSRGNPEELGEYAEGDIVFPERGRNGIVAETFRWKDGVIPYEISGYFPGKDLEVIARAMSIYKKYTCITKRASTDEDYVSIVSGNSGCWSSVGRIKGRQEVNLQSPACTTKVGTVLHELMHAAGFLHEQSRHERDDYVKIAWQNIKKGHEANFDKARKGEESGLGVPYDYRSVMHYSSTAFSSNGQPTIVPRDATKMEKMGQRNGFSKGDIAKINAMYKCPEKTAEVIKGNGTGSDIETIEKGSPSNPLVDAAAGLLSFFFNK